MNDTATLALRVDSGPVNDARNALDKFSNSANEAEKKANALGNAASKGGTQIAAAGNLARNEMINLSRQIQDVGVSLVSGQSPFMVLAQQGTQIADIFSSSKTGTVGGALKQIGSGIMNFLTPMRTLGLGIAAASAAGYAMYSSWKSFTLQLDDTARAAGTTTASLSKLQAAASVKGIAGDDFTKGIQNFARSVYDAKNNMGGLAEVFQANNVRARDFDDAMEKAANLIKNARDDQQRLVLLQQMGLPATMEWVRLMSGGAEGLRKAKAEMADFAANDEAVRRARQFDEAWNRAWTNFGLNARSAFQRALDGGAGFFDYIDGRMKAIGNSDFWKKFYDADGMKKAGVESLGNSFDARFGGDMENSAARNLALMDALRAKADALRNAMTNDPAAMLRALQLEQARLGIYGQTLTVKEQLRAIDVQIAQYSLQPGALALDKERVDTLKRLAAEQALGITQIKASTDAQRIEAETVGMSVGQAAAYAAAQNAINEARRKGMALTPENIAAIQAEANALGEAAKKADEMKWQYENLVRGPLQTFRQSLMQGASVFDALKKAANSALDSISAKLMDMIAQDLWKKALGGGSLTSWLSGLGIGGGGYGEPGTTLIGPPAPAAVNHSGYGPGDALTMRRAVHPAHFANAPRFHSGIGPGERAAVLRTDESVLTPGQMRQLAPKDDSPRVQVNIKNYSGAAVDHQQTTQGGYDIHDIVIGAVKKGTAGGELDDVMGRFSASPGTRRR